MHDGQSINAIIHSTTFMVNYLTLTLDRKSADNAALGALSH
ncbi:hypothetical protein GAGA_1436 [Paraglaciecola agarilytica NO2]|uniref:Uncharacterized protein n=1 Tax=Paraglaciecola agarilytica NO2 TaxID=1125747 RepID=A0ABQ0I4L9_9ALTE|nr:hypothetical protein GAGA_1436 [Paraglaciecola agarilytica NO2]